MLPTHPIKRLLLAGASLFALPAALATTQPPATVASLDLPRYMGRWYEIASFPNRFQRGCRCTQADYHLEQGIMRIRNACYRYQETTLDVAHGKAWPVPDSGNSRLKVRFFWPFTGDYWVLYVSPSYRTALVGSPDRDYLWILSRTRTIKKATYQRLLRIAKVKGFDTSKLNKTDQRC